MTDHKPKAVRNVLIAIIVAALFCLVMLMVSARAAAQQRCADAKGIIAALEQKYEERLIFSGVGLRGEGGFRIYASAEKTTWTLVGLPMPGLACILVTGVKYLPPRIVGQAI